MGSTHFDKVVGVNGLFTGAKGSEVGVADSSGLFQDYVFTAQSTTASTVYVVSPIAGSVAGYCASSVSAGTGRTLTVTVGSAGAVLLEAPAAGAYITSNGTIGIAVVMANTSGTTTISAGQSMSIAFASVGTAQTQTCTVIVSRTA